MLKTLTLEKIVLVQNSAPSIGRWTIGHTSPLHVGATWAFFSLSSTFHVHAISLDAKLLGNWFLYQRFENYKILHKFVTQK